MIMKEIKPYLGAAWHTTRGAVCPGNIFLKNIIYQSFWPRGMPFVMRWWEGVSFPRLSDIPGDLVSLVAAQATKSGVESSGPRRTPVLDGVLSPTSGRG